jgi:tetratricopeptide (TPR) repeat protein
LPQVVPGRDSKTMTGNRSTLSLLILVPLFLIQSAVRAQSLEERLRSDINDGRLDDFSRIESAFILSGANHPDSLKVCIDWYRNLVQTLENFRFQMTDRVGSAKKIFAYLHAIWLKKYEFGATTLLDVMNRKTFNCVSGTLLFNLICEDLGWSTDAFETPSHVYTIFNNFTEHVPVENTSPMGFDIMKNLGEYSKYLSQFYPQNQAYKIGLDRLYAYENSNGRLINNTELLGLLAYNRAYFYNKDSDFERAFEYALFAQKFNGDSRSNIDFEINLYYRWGKILYEQGKLEKAFSVCAGGFRRYPEVKDFGNNTHVIFFRILQTQRGWDAVRPFFDAVLELSVLKPEDVPGLRNYLASQESFYAGNGENGKAEEIRRYLEYLSSVSKN